MKYNKQPNKQTKKTGVGILVSDRTDFKPTKDQKRQRRALLNNKKGSTQQEELANCPKYICTQYRSTQIHKSNS